MPYRDPNNVGIWEAVIFGLISAVGGLLGYLMRAQNNKQAITYGRAALECCSSGFVGILMMLLCKALDIDWMWSGVIVGVFGWLGAETSIAVVTTIVRKKLGVKDNEDR